VENETIRTCARQGFANMFRLRDNVISAYLLSPLMIGRAAVLCPFSPRRRSLGWASVCDTEV